MKFGKRLGAEAARSWKGVYLDYKACKRAIRKDVEAQDLSGTEFQAILKLELQKISAFFTEKEEELEAIMRTINGKGPTILANFRADVLELRKYAVLNSTAVVKAVKKRNRHLRTHLGAGVAPLKANEVLSRQHFFTSPKLATLSTQAEVLAKEVPAEADAAKALEDYECPICLGVLHSPVVLTCAHRFCWGCLLAHCATSQEARQSAGHSKDEKPGAMVVAFPEDSASSTAMYGCPVCRKAHLLDLDRLQVDQTLTDFIEKLKIQQRVLAPPETSTNNDQAALKADAPSPIEEDSAHSATSDEEASSAPEPLLPPQAESVKGRLTVVLDLDGTLISSYTPRRAPSLPPGSTAYVCGKGAQLNPAGVLVVERPQLAHFFEKLNQIAEVVLFTAGLEDYAAPICQELERNYGNFTAKLFRPATVSCDAYPCVKDLSLLGRDLRRTVLVDDTPLAFLRQPDNGVPIFTFRGDVDDRVLPEAILPLLEQLAACEDVRPALHKRFNMPRWLSLHGYSSGPQPLKVGGSPAKRRLELKPAAAALTSPSNPQLLNLTTAGDVLILSDFDKTFTDFDAGERLVGELAPELVPMLSSLQQPANFVPLTNAVLSEMARRGVSRDKLLAALRQMGQELPAASLELLRWAASRGIQFRLISDCNTLFINQMLTGAKVNKLVTEVISNTSSFERSAMADSASDLTQLQSWGNGFSGPSESQLAAPEGSAKLQESSYRLVVQSRHQEASLGPHNCPLCPANLCKGLELKRLRSASPSCRILYLGDGANDFCPALCLRPEDAVLARKGYDLDLLLQKRRSQAGEPPVQAQCHTWTTHDELFTLVQRLAV